jgi:predicted DNA-binding ribbon-helix-helix protein
LGHWMKDTTLETRFVNADGRGTTLALEAPYWRFLEYVAEKKGEDWRKLVTRMLAVRPPWFKSRAAFLRLRILELVLVIGKGDAHAKVFADYWRRE